MPNFDYSSRDFDTIRSDLIARAERVFPEWTDRDPSDFGMLMIDLWAYMGDVMHYYIDRVAGEAFLPTATQRESVMALANLLDYTPRGRSSATGQVTLSNSGTSPMTIPALTQFIARSNNVTYQAYTPSGGTAPSAGSVVLTLLEGTIHIEEVLSSGSFGRVGQRYILTNEDVVSASVKVFVYEDGINLVEYVQVPRIAQAGVGDRVFTVNISAPGDVEVVFGTNVNGFVPPAGSRITATYASSSGSDGNLPSNSVAGFKSAAPVGVTIDSSTAFTGGVDEESIASLKRSIPSVISAQNRAVTATDFVNLALQVNGVAKAAISFTPGDLSNNASVTVYPQPFVVDYLTSGGTSQTVSTDMRTEVAAFLQSRALLGVTVVSAPTIDWKAIDVTATVYVNERFVANWVKADVEAALDQLFAFDNVFFGQRLTLGQVYRIILNVPGVDYAVISAFSGNSINGLTTGSILVDDVDLPKKGTVAITTSGGITVS